jgi:uncharacterized membrane protein YdjX (TVP38/TMEM64 family)
MKFLKRVGFILAIIVFLSIGFILNYYNILNPLEIKEILLINKAESVSIFIFTYMVCMLFLIPSLPLNLLSGFIWGGVLGGVYSAIGATIGSVVAFLISKFILKNMNIKIDNFKTLDKLFIFLKKSDWKLITFLRINPIFPTSIVNYMLGFLNIKVHIYTFITFISFLPWTIFFSYIGEFTESLILETDIKNFITKLIIIIALISMILLITIKIKKFFKKDDSAESNFNGIDIK